MHPHPPGIDHRIEFLRESEWCASFGERAAFIGVLSELRPSLSVEVGVARGGSLEAIARYTQGEIHSFDLDLPPIWHDLHTHHEGDSHVELPRWLSKGDRPIDFAHVDGDHSAEGTRRDLMDLLNSGRCDDCIILAHDSFNADVRAGIGKVIGHPSIVYRDLEFIRGVKLSNGECWGGYALIVTSSDRRRWGHYTP